MSAFEYFFTLYGLILGLSVVEIISGFARLAQDRRGVRVGILVPLLAALMLLDLASFWMSAYFRLQDYTLNYAVLVIAMVLSGLYYIAASVVFPRDFAAEPDFDAFYMRHRRLVVGILAGTGVMAFELLPLLSAKGRAARFAAWTDPAQFWLPLLFFSICAVIALSNNKRVNIAALIVLITSYLLPFVTSLPQAQP